MQKNVLLVKLDIKPKHSRLLRVLYAPNISVIFEMVHFMIIFIMIHQIISATMEIILYKLATYKHIL